MGFLVMMVELVTMNTMVMITRICTITIPVYVAPLDVDLSKSFSFTHE